VKIYHRFCIVTIVLLVVIMVTANVLAFVIKKKIAAVTHYNQKFSQNSSFLSQQIFSMFQQHLQQNTVAQN